MPVREFLCRVFRAGLRKSHQDNVGKLISGIVVDAPENDPRQRSKRLMGTPSSSHTFYYCYYYAPAPLPNFGRR